MWSQRQKKEPDRLEERTGKKTQTNHQGQRWRKLCPTRNDFANQEGHWKDWRWNLRQRVLTDNRRGEQSLPTRVQQRQKADLRNSNLTLSSFQWEVSHAQPEPNELWARKLRAGASLNYRLESMVNRAEWIDFKYGGLCSELSRLFQY